ncbi:MAG: hypothetical protein JSR71_12340, partial [Proteobacteria bacterium]|nr:hypothetical protein [Pseudomonadota bacterium]
MKQIHKKLTLAHPFNLASRQTLRMMRDLHLVRRNHEDSNFPATISNPATTIDEVITQLIAIVEMLASLVGGCKANWRKSGLSWGFLISTGFN